MRFTNTNRRIFAQRTNERINVVSVNDLLAEAPAYPAHGQIVGRIVLELHGLRISADLLSTGKHCRSYGVRIDGEVVGVLGADRAWREISRRMPRMGSKRNA